MVLEGLVTTLNADGTPHLAPMGPEVPWPDFRSFTLKPFKTSQSYKNLLAHGEGVMHATDDILLLARAAVGAVAEFPPHFDAITVQGRVLANACRFWEFRVQSLDDRGQRVRIECDVYHCGVLRPAFGYNRAQHAVLEAAIHATRFHLTPADEIEAEFHRLRAIVDKTAGPSEIEAMTLLEFAWKKYREASR